MGLKIFLPVNNWASKVRADTGVEKGWWNVDEPLTAAQLSSYGRMLEAALEMPNLKPSGRAASTVACLPVPLP